MKLENEEKLRLSVLLYSGLKKISSVIESNISYDAILGDRLKKSEYQVLLNSAGKVNVNAAQDFLINKLKILKCKAYVIPNLEFDTILAYGSTKNNLREIRFFSETARLEGYEPVLSNIAQWKFSKEVVRLEKSDLLDAFLYSVLRFFNKKDGEISLSLVHQMLGYYVAALRMFDVFTKLRSSKLIVANDHSPIPVAVHKIATFFDTKVCYVQHAEVTGSFPRLDFDYSILRNNISKQTYLAIGSPRGVIQIIDRDREKTRTSNTAISVKESMELIKNEEYPLIIIYLSAVYNQDELLKLYKAIQHLDHNIQVLVKLHPSQNYSSFFSKNNIDVTGEHVDVSHIAICGNSSVVIELMKKGCLVFQCFALDFIADDYYGFRKKGLVISLSYQDIVKKFWKNIDLSYFNEPVWAKYDPGAGSSENMLDFHRVPVFFKIFFEKSFSDNDFKRQSFLRDLNCFPLTLILNERSGTNYYDKLMIKNELELLFNKRDPLINNLCAQHDASICQSFFDFWIITKKIEWNGFIPNIQILEALIKFIKNLGSESSLVDNKKLVLWCEKKIFTIIIRNFSPKYLIDFLLSCAHLCVSNLTTNQKVSFVNYTLGNPNYAKALKIFFDVGHQSVSRFERLKIDVQCALVDSSGQYLYSDYKKIEQQFLECLPSISEQYKNSMMSLHQLIAGRDKFINVKLSMSERESFLNLVERYLISKNGFSFIRLGDGEGFVFKSENGLYTDSDSLNRQRHWWGCEIPVALEEQLREDIKIAICNADVIGIPSVHRFLRDSSDKTSSLSQTIQGRGLISVIEGMKKLDDGKMLYSDNMLNIYCLNEMSILCRLANFASRVIVVNSGDPDVVLQCLSPYFEFHHIPVPTHFKTSSNSNYTHKSKPLPYLYKDIEQQIEKLTVPGTLVLVGAGLAGKTFLNIAKQQGGVGLDLGSAMDQFIGGNIHSLY